MCAEGAKRSRGPGSNPRLARCEPAGNGSADFAVHGHQHGGQNFAVHQDSESTESVVSIYLLYLPDQQADFRKSHTASSANHLRRKSARVHDQRVYLQYLGQHQFYQGEAHLFVQKELPTEDFLCRILGTQKKY